MIMLNACSTTIAYAPVVDGWHQTPDKSGYYTVQRGDSLYSIAWAFGLDFRDLARANHLTSSYGIKVGQHLRMVTTPYIQPAIVKTAWSTPVKQTNMAKPVAHKATLAPAKTFYTRKSVAPSAITVPVMANAANNWLWPTQGKVVTGFSNNSGGNKGLDIAGRLGQPILASAAGKVVYSGSGLRGYGKLIIIKHNDNYLSAYAFNKVLMVKEGTIVKAGQQIAQMGQDDTGKTMLHFEIRLNGKPVDPLLYLKTR